MKEKKMLLLVETMEMDVTVLQQDVYIIQESGDKVDRMLKMVRK